MRINHLLIRIAISNSYSFRLYKKSPSTIAFFPKSYYPSPFSLRFSRSFFLKGENHFLDTSKNYDLIQHTIRTSKQFKRFQPMIQLASSSSSFSNNIQNQTIALDVGCDHGLLSFALSYYYKKVIGIDKSQEALERGALLNYQKIQNYFTNDNVEFKVGDGLEFCASPQNKYVHVYMAGMGVNTILDILSKSREKLQNIHCSDLIIQPASSKPRYLMQLYQVLLKEYNYKLEYEAIDYISKRWYLTSHFSRIDSSSEFHDVIPGMFLSQSSEFERYVAFHAKWIQEDKDKCLNELQMFERLEYDLEWLNSPYILTVLQRFGEKN